MAGYVVLLTDGAERDLEEIHRYVAKADCRAKANQLLDRLLEVAEGLETFPERGRFLEELQGLGGSTVKSFSDRTESSTG